MAIKEIILCINDTSTTKDSKITSEISFATNGILNGENQHSKNGILRVTPEFMVRSFEGSI